MKWKIKKSVQKGNNKNKNILVIGDPYDGQMMIGKVCSDEYQVWYAEYGSGGSGNDYYSKADLIDIFRSKYRKERYGNYMDFKIPKISKTDIKQLDLLDPYAEWGDENY